MNNILVPIDFSDLTDRVVSTAETLARKMGSKIWLLHCVRDYPVLVQADAVPPAPLEAEQDTLARFPEEYQQLEKIGADLKSKGINVETLFAVGLPADEILYVAERFDADLIVMGSHGHGTWYEAVVGSVTKAILRQTSRLVMVVPTKMKEPVDTTNERDEPVAVA